MKTYNLTKNQPAAPNWGPLVAKVKDRINIVQVADALGIAKKFNMQKTGTSIQGDCPTGHPSTSHRCFSIDMDDDFFHCFSCNESGDIISLVELVNQVSFMEAIKWLVDTFAKDLSVEVEEFFNQLSPEEKAFFEKGNLYRAIFEEGKKQLSSPAAQPVRDYLEAVSKMNF